MDRRITESVKFSWEKKPKRVVIRETVVFDFA